MRDERSGRFIDVVRIGRRAVEIRSVNPDTDASFAVVVDRAELLRDLGAVEPEVADAVRAQD